MNNCINTQQRRREVRYGYVVVGEKKKREEIEEKDIYC